MAMARYYEAGKNPDGAFFVGVPLADLSDEDWAALPARQQAAADAAPYYRKTKPRPVTDPQEDAHADGKAAAKNKTAVVDPAAAPLDLPTAAALLDPGTGPYSPANTGAPVPAIPLTPDSPATVAGLTESEPRNG